MTTPEFHAHRAVEAKQSQPFNPDAETGSLVESAGGFSFQSHDKFTNACLSSEVLAEPGAARVLRGGGISHFDDEVLTEPGAVRALRGGGIANLEEMRDMVYRYQKGLSSNPDEFPPIPERDAMLGLPKLPREIMAARAAAQELAPEIAEKDFSGLSHFARRAIEGVEPRVMERELARLSNSINTELAAMDPPSPLRVRMLLDRVNDDFVFVVRDESNSHYGRMIIAPRKTHLTEFRKE